MPLGACGGDEVLPGALGDDHDRVSLRGKPPFEFGEEALATIEGERDLGDEAEVDIAARERGMRRDETRVAPHELHEAYAVPRSPRLDVRGRNHVARGLHGGRKPEAARRPLQVVVDRLGDPDDGDRKSAPVDLVGDRGGPAQAAIAAEDEEDAESTLDERVDHTADLLRAARGAEHRPAALVEILDQVRRKGDRLVDRAVGEARVAVAETQDAPDAVSVVEFEDDRPDDVVQAGAEAAAGEDAAGEILGVEEDPIAGARGFEGGWLLAGIEAAAQPADRRIEEDPVVVADAPLHARRDRAGMASLAEAGDRQVGRRRAHRFGIVRRSFGHGGVSAGTLVGRRGLGRYANRAGLASGSASGGPC